MAVRPLLRSPLPLLACATLLPIAAACGGGSSVGGRGFGYAGGAGHGTSGTGGLAGSAGRSASGGGGLLGTAGHSTSGGGGLLGSGGAATGAAGAAGVAGATAGRSGTGGAAGSGAAGSGAAGSGTAGGGTSGGVPDAAADRGPATDAGTDLGADAAAVCDPIRQTGCAAGQKCGVPPGCFTNGTIGNGMLCALSGFDDCAAPDICVGDGVGHVCRQVCGVDSDCTAPAVPVGTTPEPGNLAHCLITLTSSTFSTCTLACNPVTKAGASGCPAGYACGYFHTTAALSLIHI